MRGAQKRYAGEAWQKAGRKRVSSVEMEINFRISDAVGQSQRFRCHLAPPLRLKLHNFLVRTERGGDYVNSFQAFHSCLGGVASGWVVPRLEN